MPWTNISTDSQLIAIHSALLPTEPDGVVLYYGDWTGGLGGGKPTDGRRFRMAPGLADPIEADFGALPTTDCFCGGQSFLADGRLLSGGGTVGGATDHGVHQHYPGERACWMYLPRANTWVQVDDFHFQPDSESIGGGRWYPTLVTLPNGEVLAVGGHPMVDDYYPANDDHRHNNNTPERYSPGADRWTLLTADITAPPWLSTDGYPRFHLMPSGLLFFDTAGKRDNKRLFDPYNGVWTGPDIDNLDTLPPYYAEGSAASSVLLPLMPPNYPVRILATNSPDDTAFRIDVDETPSWQPTVERTGVAAGRNRENGCATLLPTGQVVVTGGWPGAASTSNDPADATVHPELYTPGIDWAAGNFSDTASEEWVTLDDPAPTRRGYHSGALLLPDGRVWHGGSTTDAEPKNLNIEVFTPPYADNVGGRPTISECPPNIGYLHPFIVETPDAGSIARIALMRCGSITHGFDSDQRYVGLQFTHTGGNELQVTAPPEPKLAPPGYYMLFLIDDQDRVCERASFIRVSKQKLVISADISTFSIHEVDALGPTSTFVGALTVVFDGFMPHEITPLSWELLLPNGEDIPDVEVSIGDPHYEAGQGQADIAQRVAFPVTLSFTSLDAFDAIPDDEDFITCTFSAKAGFFFADTKVRLSKKQNPRMSDGEPPWLSIDLRVFKINPEDDFVAGIEHPAASEGAAGAYGYIQSVLTAFNEQSGDANHPFDALPIDQEAARLELGVNDPDGVPVFNYAIARVRFVAPVDINAVDVAVFFRMWTTGWSALEFDTSRNYRRDGEGPGATPLLGLQGGEISSIPCFAQARTADMDMQQDETNRLTLEGKDNVEVHGYFGCWLDVNQDIARFPLEPQGNGPFGADALTIQQLMRGLHQCLVAEIHYSEDVILLGDTPSSSDNLAQRNILFDYSDNPGSFAAHLVHHSFEFKPSPFSFEQSVLAPDRFGTAAGRLHPDELVIDWGNLPRDSLVTFYMPQVDANEIVRAAAARQAPGNLVAAGPGTIRCKVTDIGFIPLPGPLPRNIACLMTVQLPPGVPYGRTYRVVVRQVGGRELKVLGTTEFRIEVRRSEQIVGRLSHDLAVLKHIGLSIPPSNRWYPVFERYLAELGDRVRAMGGDPDTIDPNPHGTGGPAGKDKDGKDGKVRCVTGYIAALHYGCCGGFEGFTLSNCDGEWRFDCVKSCLESVLLTSVREKMQVTVHARDASAIDRVINKSCPWSGRPVNADALTRYRGETVGFCGPEHRDRFAKALAMFDRAPAKKKALPAPPPSPATHAASRGHALEAVVLADKSETRREDVSGHRPEKDKAPVATAAKEAEPAREEGTIAVNPRCPWSGKAVAPGAATGYDGKTVGFCNPRHRDEFAAAIRYFDERIDCSERCERNSTMVERVDLKP